MSLHLFPISSSFFFFFNDTATTEIYTLSLHDALPISLPQIIFDKQSYQKELWLRTFFNSKAGRAELKNVDRKSTRLNSSHANISYAVFCLKKKNKRRIMRGGTQECQKRRTSRTEDATE